MICQAPSSPQSAKSPARTSGSWGGGEACRDFLKEDLVDELYMGIVPTLLGEGIPLFPSGFPQREFDLLENKTYSQSLIAIRYERARKESKKSKKAN